MVEFEFNSIGRRLFGEAFKAGRGGAAGGSVAQPGDSRASKQIEQLVLESEVQELIVEKEASSPKSANLQTIVNVPHQYQIAATPAERAALINELQGSTAFSFNVQTTSFEPKEARLVGLAFSLAPHSGHYVPFPRHESEARQVLEEFRPVLQSDRVEKVGHNLKFDLTVLKWFGINVGGKLFDTMIAHSLIEPEMRHALDYVAEAYLHYTPIPINRFFGEANAEQFNLEDAPPEKLAEYAVEDVDLALQLRAALEPLLKEKGQERVFYEVESPLLPVLVDMEYEGIKVDAAALADFAAQLAKEIDQQERAICRLAGTTFNLNSPRQLGQILF